MNSFQFNSYSLSFKRFATLLLSFLLLSCGVIDTGKDIYRKLARNLFPKDCKVDVSFDIEKYYYFEDQYYAKFRFSEKVEEAEFVPAVHFEPEAKYKSLNYPDTVLDRYEMDSMAIEGWDLKPGVAYKITIDPFFSATDCKLSESKTFDLPAKEYRPYFSLTRNNIIEAEGQKIYPIQVRNLKDLNIKYADVSINDLIGSISSNGRNYKNINSGMNWTNLQWTVSDKTNFDSEHGFELETIQGKKKYFWTALKVTQDVVEWGEINTKSKTENTIIQSTNIGITTKEDNEFIYVWLNTLSAAKPIKDGKVSFYSSASQIGSCQTDSDGYCSIPKSIAKVNDRSIIIAETSSDKAFLYFDESKLYGHFYYSNTSPLSAKVYFDRKLYRPGETVEIKAIIGQRKKNSFVPYSGNAITIQITNTKGQNVLSKTLTTSNQGGIWTDFSIPKDAPLGHYTVYIKSGSSSTISSDSFQVEEFRPVSFAVKINTEQSEITKDTDLNFAIQANYLFGTPMGSSKYKYSILKKSHSVSFQNYPNHVFGYQNDYYDYEYEDSYYEETSGYISGSEGKLESDGIAKIKTSIDRNESIFNTENEKITIADPYRVLVEATVYDVDDKSITKTQSINYYPSDAFIGISCNDRYDSINKPIKFSLLTVDKSGKPKDNHDVTAYIVHNDWSSVESKGFASSIFRSNSLEKKTIETKKLKLSGKAIDFEYVSKYPGSHTLLVVDKNGGYSRMDFYVYKKDNFYSWDFRSDDAIQLTTDKPKYNIGDTAKIIIKSPYPEARAILSIERDQLYWSKSINIKGNSEPIEIPIKAEYLPNVEFNVVLLSGRMEAPKDLSDEDRREFKGYDFGIPKVKMGAVHLKVNLDSKNAPLEVQLDKAEYSPRSKVTVKIKTLPKAEILLAVSDRGILDLVNYYYSSPVSQFYKLWNNIVASFDFRDWIVKQSIYEGKGDSPGGDYGDDQSDGGFGLDSEDGMRKDFRPTAYWNPNIVADSDGEAEISFNLPDNLTTFRVMASASKDGNYAVSNTEFIVKKSLILKKNAPRFVRIDDSIQVGATITNNTKIKSKFKISIESPDVTLTNASATIDLKELETKEYTTNLVINPENYEAIVKKLDGKETEVKFIVKAEPTDYGSFTKSGISKNDITDSFEIKIPIRKPEPVLTNRISGYTDESNKYELSYPNEKNVLLKQASLNLNFSGTVLTGLKNAFDFYGSNPYFCMEQRTSAYLLSISAGNLLKQFNYSPPSDQSYDFNNIEKLFLDEMASFQNSDGSFRLWKEESAYSYGYPYLTAYVIHTMQLGRKYGFRINTTAYNKGMNYLKASIKNPKESEKDSFQTLSLLYSVLSRDGLDTQGLEKSIIDNFAKLNPKSQGIFLSAYYDARRINNLNDDPQIKKLYKIYLDQFKISDNAVDLAKDHKKEYWMSYYSKGSAIANLLSVLVRYEPNNPNLPKIIQFVLSAKSGNLWMDTQSSGTLAFALREYRDLFEATDSDTEFQIKVGDTKIISDSIGSGDNSIKSIEYKLSSLSKDWNFPSKEIYFNQTGSKGRLYYNSTLNYTPLKEETKSASQGLTVTKEIFSIDGKDDKGNFNLKKEGSKLKRGTIYVVKITVESKEVRNFVMIEDFIPSNVEVVNSKFETESGDYSSLESDNSDDKRWWENTPTYKEYRDDKVLFSKDYLTDGSHSFTYLIRPLSFGKSIVPASRAFTMYDSLTFGNTSTSSIQVE
ncbi:alpha-2-macroglobulin family protein [Leptospira sp. GIMC2001]|uniref:alpha-2-macroglobulin family protein n=1 Tax=Leptospira sp. GIMC2001 TaxID=1513297 RepID=UPI00234AA3D9|nr:MG2 domain-containing protein [Leptospira sp. GIMC2001]WCL50107.1 MG2 domain-containing protein [Leptospira sp. GIMC2001]